MFRARLNFNELKRIILSIFRSSVGKREACTYIAFIEESVDIFRNNAEVFRLNEKY